MSKKKKYKKEIKLLRKECIVLNDDLETSN